MDGAVKPSGQRAIVWLFASLLVVGAGLSGCGDDGQKDPIVIGEPDAGGDAAVPDIGPDSGDDAAGDAGEDTGREPGPCPPPPTAVGEATEVEFDTWVVTGVGSGSDGVRGALERREFETPDPGEMAYGTDWEEREQDEDGAVDVHGLTGMQYAATRVEREEDGVLVARADDAYRVYVNGAPLAADVYGHSDKRVPIPLEAGDNHIVLQFVGRMDPEFAAVETPDEVYFNTEDITSPHLRVGTDDLQPLGVSLVNTSGVPLDDTRAQVLENEYFEATTVEYPSLGADTVTQVGFELEPKQTWEEPDETIPVTLRLESCSLWEAYEIEIELETIDEQTPFRRTFWSPVDGSVQYYGVHPPTEVEAARTYGMVLSLHGAGVEGINLANSYSPKDWTYIITPTNRRRFGFNWEEWGRLNGLASLDDAMDAYQIDDTRVYVTGHSMGGHGTWHLGTMHPGRFAAIGPSAGWSTIYSYGGTDRPSEPFSGARAHSDTMAYLSNLARRGAYIIHGTEDDNVPIEEGYKLRDGLEEHTDDIIFHEEEGAKHWWDGDVAEGTDCVDWPPLFEFFEERTLDPYELDFEFTSPGAYYSTEHSYVSSRSDESPLDDIVITSEQTGDAEVTVTTENVRSMDLDGAALEDKGIEEVVVDGDRYEVAPETIEIGPREGKRPGQNGPLNPVFQRPFCFVYPDDGPEAYREYAAYLLSTWSALGNGHGCALAFSEVDDAVRDERNLIYLGVDEEDALADDPDRPFGWTSDWIEIGDSSYRESAGFVVFPQDDGLAAAFVATAGYEFLLFRLHPFSSRSGMPDYLVWGSLGGRDAGFFGPDWEL